MPFFDRGIFGRDIGWFDLIEWFFEIFALCFLILDCNGIKAGIGYLYLDYE